MKNNRKYIPLPKPPRTQRIVNGDEMRAERDFLAEYAAVALEETAETTEVDFDRLRPRLDALGLSVKDRLERIGDIAPDLASVAFEEPEPEAVVLQFPFGSGTN